MYGPSTEIDNSVPVTAYDFNTRKVIGTFESMAIACKRLYIRQSASIFQYMRSKGRSKGVKSYKSGVYHFEYA